MKKITALLVILACTLSTSYFPILAADIPGDITTNMITDVGSDIANLNNTSNPIYIDTTQAYEGMDNSFADGYSPTIENDIMHLVIPFMSSEAFEDNKISVRIAFENTGEPFIYKNYYKEVTKSKESAYLYKNDIDLDANRTNGQYTIKVLVSGTTSGGKCIEDTYDIYINITDGLNISSDTTNDVTENNLENINQDPAQNDGDSKDTSEAVRHQPKVLLVENSLSGTKLKAGDSYEFKIAFKNVSKQYSMENIKITMTTEYAGIAFDKTNWYIENISPGKNADISQNISVDLKAVYGNVKLNYEFQYDDNEGNTYTSTEIISLFVTQPVKASLNGDTFPQKAKSTETVPMNFQVENAGLSPIYNVRVHIEGAGIFPTKELFWGTMEAGSSDEGEIPIYIGMKNMNDAGEVIEGEAYGNTTVKVIFTYEDADGQVISEEKEYKTAIIKPKDNKESETKKSTQWINAIYIGSVLLLLIVLIVCIIKMICIKKTFIYRK